MNAPSEQKPGLDFSRYEIVSEPEIDIRILRRKAPVTKRGSRKAVSSEHQARVGLAARDRDSRNWGNPCDWKLIVPCKYGAIEVLAHPFRECLFLLTDYRNPRIKSLWHRDLGLLYKPNDSGLPVATLPFQFERYSKKCDGVLICDSEYVVHVGDFSSYEVLIHKLPFPLQSLDHALLIPATNERDWHPSLDLLQFEEDPTSFFFSAVLVSVMQMHLGTGRVHERYRAR